jgi:hypothetical protein
LSQFTSRHYAALADVLKSQRSECSMNAHRQMLNRVTSALADMLAADNPLFDRGKFTDAAGMTVPADENRATGYYVEQTPGGYRATGLIEDMPPCDECGAPIPDSEPSMVNAHHEESCSLHPSASNLPAGCTCGGIGDTGSHFAGCPWACR